MAYVTPQRLIDRLGPRHGVSLAMAAILIVALADYVTGYAVRLSILYLVPIALAAWTAGVVMGIAAAAVSTFLWLLSFRSEHPYPDQVHYFWEAAVMLGGFLAFAWLIARLRRALNQADERFFRVLEEMRAAVYVADERRDAIVYANPEMIRIGGSPHAVTPSEFQNQFVRETDSGDVVMLPQAETGFPSGTLKNPRTGRWYLMRAGSIPWGSNPDVKLRVLTDITERKNAELLREKHLEVMHQAAQLTTLAELASTLAHEINQPLMVIATYTDACQRLLDAPDADHGEISRVLGKCHAQAVRAAAIIERLREFIRQRQHRPSPCDAHAMVAEAIDVVRPQLDEACIALDAAVTTPGPLIVADKILLTQVLVNLMRNAIDAMRDTPPAERHISIAVAVQSAGAVEFSVADSGPGLNIDSGDNIFAPFFTTKPDGLGLGLGLAICRSVAEAHNGRLWATGNPQGGATFFLSIPAGNVGP